MKNVKTFHSFSYFCPRRQHFLNKNVVLTATFLLNSSKTIKHISMLLALVFNMLHFNRYDPNKQKLLRYLVFYKAIFYKEGTEQEY